MAHEVFISHSSKDKAVADAVCASIEASGIRCWIAPRDIRSGQVWAGAIVEAIQSCRIMVLIFSSSSNNSRDVAKELTVAVDSGAIVIPFRIDDIMPQGVMRYYLSDTHWLDAMNPPTGKQVRALVETVRSVIEAPESSRFAADSELRARKPSSKPGRTAALGIAAAFVIVLAGILLMSRAREESSAPPAVPEPGIRVAEPVEEIAPDEPEPVKDIKPEEPEPARVAVPVEGQNWVSPSTGMEFVWIPDMGMWVGKYEVTNGEYRKNAPGHDSGRHTVEMRWRDSISHSLNGDRQPAVRVSFDDAKEYAVWMTARDWSFLPDGYAYRLPSIDEWIEFARCGDGRRYPWGDDWPPTGGRAGNYADETAGEAGVISMSGIIRGYFDGNAVSAHVDDLWVNPWGLAGAGGNVWEACTHEDRFGITHGVWLGSSWGDSVGLFVRDTAGCGGTGYVDNNYGYHGFDKGVVSGFRLVMSKDAAAPAPEPVIPSVESLLPEQPQARTEGIVEGGPVEGQDWVSPATGMEFVWISAMDMWVGKYEVTNREYRMKAPEHDSGAYDGHTLDGERQPVVYVDFDDGKAYAAWMTEKDGMVLPSGYRYRLPLVDEWVYFARCGDERRYPWGVDWPPESGRAGNYADETARESGILSHGITGYRDGHSVTAPVDELWANPWGLHGVGGNVWEACASSPDGGRLGSWMGSSWYEPGIPPMERHLTPGMSRAAGMLSVNSRHRSSRPPSYNYGFRLVLSVD